MQLHTSYLPTDYKGKFLLVEGEARVKNKPLCKSFHVSACVTFPIALQAKAEPIFPFLKLFLDSVTILFFTKNSG